MKPTTHRLAALLSFYLATLLALTAATDLGAAELARDSGISQAEAAELKKRGEQILSLIWNRRVESAYGCTSSQYRKQISLKDFSTALRSINLQITGRKLVDIFLLKDAKASASGRTMHLFYHTNVKGERKPAVEHLFLIKEGGNWVMTGHWIGPGK